MNIIILEKSKETAEKLSYLLLSVGIKCLYAQLASEALQQIMDNPAIKIGIIDIDNKEVEGLRFISEVTDQYAGRFRFIIHSALTMDNLPSELLDSNIIGHILKPFDDERVNSSLRIIFSSINFPQLDKRAHIRAFIDQEDLLRINLKLRDYKHIICGKIINLSLGGAAIELLGPLKINLLKESTHIPKIEFTINCKIIDTSGLVILRRGKILAIRFHGLKPEDRNTLAKYILDKLASYPKRHNIIEEKND